MLEKKLKEAKEFIFKNFSQIPETAVVLGSGLGKITENLTEAISVQFDEIPHFFNPSVQGHSGKLIFGKLNEKAVFILSGRIHAYEGHSLDDVVFPVRLMRFIGVKNLLLTNASGGVNKSFAPGELCLITDQINLTGTNPLLGPNHEFLGTRFPDMSKLYAPSLRKIMVDVAKESDIKLHQGIYAGVLGPSYETPSEVRMIKTLGGDLVGMSTVFEAIAAHHAGLKVCGVSCVTNMASGILDKELAHEDIKEKANLAFQSFSSLIEKFIEKL
jgi:purine-nucleoside phosphorylase